MLESLTLKNWQRHKKLVVPLGRGVTTLVGPTDAGKSAVLRALRWVALNQPSGDAYRRHGTKRTSVTLRVDGHVIRRERARGVNRYVVDGKPLKAFGRVPPPEVTRLLRLSGDNFQAQLDRADGTGPTFWFALSPSALSRALNEVVDLSDVDRVLSWISREGKRASAEARVVSKRADEARVRVSRTKGVVVAEREAARLAVLSEGARADALRASTLRALVRKGTTLAERRDERSRALAAALNVKRAGERWSVARGSARSLRETRALALSLQETMGVSQTLEWPAALENSLETLKRSGGAAHSLRALVSRARASDLEIEHAKTRLGTLEERFHEEFSDDGCPLCGAEVKA